MVLCLACRTGRNYPEPAEPRYSGVLASTPTDRGDTLLVVSFNVEFSNEVQRAIKVLKYDPALRDADLVLLQEMTAPAARTIADSLGMSHVYYPAIYNKVYKRDVGNAVLSRWPIIADRKVILPARSRYAKTQRIATAATLRIRGRSVRVYSTHLGTPADLGREGRAEQLRFIMTDAMAFSPAIIGGDMNSRDIGEVAVQNGWLWATSGIPKSNSFGRLDHIFLRGYAPIVAGTVSTPNGISDHRPIWLKAVPQP